MIWEKAKASIKGKWRPYTVPVHRPDPDDDDCQVLEVFAVMPFSYALPYTVSDTTAGAGDSAAADRGKKRAADAPASVPKQKKAKKTARKVYAPPKPKQRVAGTG